MKRCTKLIALTMAIIMVAALSVVTLSAHEPTYDEVDVVALIEAHVYVDQDGLVSFDLPHDVLILLGEEADSFYQWIDYLNEQIEEEVLAITSNLTIYEVDDDILIIQGGNVNGHSYHWWGMRLWKCRATANTTVALLRAGGYITGLGGLATFFPPVVVAGLGAAALQNVLANRIEYHNNKQNRGVRVDLHWTFVTFSVNPQ